MNLTNKEYKEHGEQKHLDQQSGESGPTEQECSKEQSGSNTHLINRAEIIETISSQGLAEKTKLYLETLERLSRTFSCPYTHPDIRYERSEIKTIECLMRAAELEFTPYEEWVTWCKQLGEDCAPNPRKPNFRSEFIELHPYLRHSHPIYVADRLISAECAWTKHESQLVRLKNDLSQNLQNREELQTAISQAGFLRRMHVKRQKQPTIDRLDGEESFLHEQIKETFAMLNRSLHNLAYWGLRAQTTQVFPQRLNTVTDKSSLAEYCSLLSSLKLTKDLTVNQIYRVNRTSAVGDTTNTSASYFRDLAWAQALREALSPHLSALR